MSFYFSGDEEDDDDLDLDAFDDTGLLALASRERAEGPSAAAAAASPAAAAAASSSNADDDGGGGGDAFDEEDSDGGDWGNVDWEDADQGDEDDDVDDGEPGGDAPTNFPFPTQPVMINFGRATGRSNDPDEGIDERKEGAKENDGEGQGASSKKRKRKTTTRVLRNVPHETQQMVLDVRRSEMLCHAVHCMRCSCTCGGANLDGSDDDGLLLSHVACSLIPQEFHPKESTTDDSMGPPDKSRSAIPTKDQLRAFTQWFFQFVNRAGERRRDAFERNVAQGAASARPRTPRRRGPRRSAKTKQSTNKAKKGVLVDESDAVDDASTYAPHNRNAEFSSTDLLQRLLHLSPHYDEDPQLLDEGGVDAIDAVEGISPQEKALLLLAMVR